MKRVVGIIILSLLPIFIGLFPLSAATKKKNVNKGDNLTTISDAVPLIQGEWQVDAPKGLSRRTIALWNSHGYYYDREQQIWKWQRPRLFGSVEDLLTRTFTAPFLIPMLENAGAYVVTPCERDTSIFEAIVDADGALAFTTGYKEANGRQKWKEDPQGFAFDLQSLPDGYNPFNAGKSRRVKSVKESREQSTAQYYAQFPRQGDYALYVSYVPSPSNATSVPYIVHTLGGDLKAMVNQTIGAGTWIYLGTFTFPEGLHKILTVSNCTGSENETVSADAVKVGGGMGHLSGKPHFVEGARYWMQLAGVPDSVYSPTGFENDYIDDYRSRGLWVNFLSGGSSTNHSEPGLGIPVDLSFALHTDAGTLGADSIVGTMAIYSTDGRNPYGDGSSRLTAAKQYADLVQGQVVNDIQRTFEPEWTRRKLRKADYAEARSPKVPSMILELLSHQNPADMRYALNPEFRFTVSRAIYKGILRFLAQRHGYTPVIQPLPVKAFSIESPQADGNFLLRWQDRPDPLEASANPHAYIVEMRINDGAFVPVTVTQEKYWKFDTALPDSIYSFRIVAVNDGGRSFPSETLACGYTGKKGQWVNVVNGFTRLSAPEWFETEDYAGFINPYDTGVTLGNDYGYTGAQYEFDKCAEWVDNDFPGFGASHADMEARPVAGNTFDYPYIHGKAIMNAGGSFVSSSLEAFTQHPHGSWSTVDLIMGKQRETSTGSASFGTRHKAFPHKLQEALQRCAENGKSLLVSGAYFANDLYDNPFSDDATRGRDESFARNILGVEWLASKAAITGKAYETGVIEPFKDLNFNFTVPPATADLYIVGDPDALNPASKENGKVIMRYKENNLPAAVAGDFKDRRIVAIGFPFEVIADEKSRHSLMKQILNYFEK